jgi:hypothetical protein
MEVTTKKLPEFLGDVLAAGLVPFITSHPGVGKSAIAAQVADTYNLKLIDIRLSQCDQTDLNGFPSIKNGKATYIPFDTFPLEGDEIPEGYKGWLIVLDEFPSAVLSVQAAAYKLLHDKCVGQHRLHKNVAMIAAGNRQDSGAIVNPMTTAVQSRFVHFQVIPDILGWIEWADKHDIDHRWKSLVNYKPDLLTHFNPDHNDHTFSCARTIDYASRITKNIASENMSKKLPVIAGTVGEGCAREFVNFCKVYKSLPSIEDILRHPLTITINPEPSVQWALTGLIINNTNVNNIADLMKFICRLPMEFQVITLRAITRKNEELEEHPLVYKWIEDNKHFLGD